MKDTETWNKLAAEIAALMAERDELRERVKLLESGAIYAGSVLQSRDDAEKAIYDYCGNDCYRDACAGDAEYSVCPLARTSSKPEISIHALRVEGDCDEKKYMGVLA